MDGLLEALFAAILIGTGAAGLIQLRGAPVADRVFWLIGFGAFTAAGIAAMARLAFGGEMEAIYINVLGFALSVGFFAFLVADASHLLSKPLPERGKTLAVVAAVVIYGVAVVNNRPELMGIATIAAAVGLIGLGLMRYDAAPQAAIWTIIGAVGIGLLPIFAGRFAGPLGTGPQDVGHVALAIGVYALMRAALATGAPKVRA